MTTTKQDIFLLDMLLKAERFPDMLKKVHEIAKRDPNNPNASNSKNEKDRRESQSSLSQTSQVGEGKEAAKAGEETNPNKVKRILQLDATGRNYLMESYQGALQPLRKAWIIIQKAIDKEKEAFGSTFFFFNF